MQDPPFHFRFWDVTAENNGEQIGEIVADTEGKRPKIRQFHSSCSTNCPTSDWYFSGCFSAPDGLPDQNLRMTVVELFIGLPALVAWRNSRGDSATRKNGVRASAVENWSSALIGPRTVGAR